MAQIGIFSDFYFFGIFVHNTLQNHTNLKCWGEYLKIQEICNKMSTKILKIDGEMPDEIELKVGNPQNSNSRNWANLSQPWNIAFFGDEIFQLFFQSYAPKVPEWKIAHIEWSKKAQNTRKSPKNEWFRRSYVNPPFWEHPVDIYYLSARMLWQCWRCGVCRWCSIYTRGTLRSSVWSLQTFSSSWPLPIFSNLTDCCNTARWANIFDALKYFHVSIQIFFRSGAPAW